MNINELPTILIHDPLAEYLGGPADVESFSITLLDAARLSGHLCPSVVGAFLVTQAAIKVLFADNGICERGLIAVDIPGAENERANGPMGHVISYITGAWSESGFGGLGDQFIRRNLLRFNSKRLTQGQFRFERLDTGKVVEVSYFPSRAKPHPPKDSSFQSMWQQRVSDILSSDNVVEVHKS